MSTTFWDALLHLNYGCALAASRIKRNGRSLEFPTPQHGEQEILINEVLSRQIHAAIQSGLELLAEIPLSTESTTPWRDAECRRAIEETMPRAEKLCSELQSRHDSLRDEHGAHAAPIESCHCDMSRLHRVLVNAIENARGKLLG